jgi:hypothetical protein
MGVEFEVNPLAYGQQIDVLRNTYTVDEASLMTLTLCNSGLTGSSSGSLASNRSNCSELNTEEFKDDCDTNEDVELCDDRDISLYNEFYPHFHGDIELILYIWYMCSDRGG